LKSLELLYNGNSTDFCKERFRDYLITKVVYRTEDSDNALKKFFKNLLGRFSESNPEEYENSNLADVIP
jgi:hypothetical protein